ncbi:MAG TPA: hypothetical protein PK765_05360 [bacterium]|nr:hypothetical protein [bacterium]
MIGSALPALAETAPKQVLNFVNNHLSRLDVLFTKTGSFPFSSWPHTNLLWALELISLEPELFEESVEVLLVLEKNYGSTIAQNYSNSPINSLVNLFLPWKSNAHVEVTEKMQILRRMSRSYPDMAYRLVGRILTTHTSIPPMQPRYRQNPTEKSVTWEQYFSSCNELTAIFVNLMAGREDL